jgi:hypothetical protein
VWALPFSIWLAVTLGSALALPVRIGEWVSLHRSYAYDAQNGGEAVDAMHSVDLEQLLEVLANVGVLGLGIAAALVYRRRVPLNRRGTWRAFVIAVVAVGGLALVGYVVIASALKGAIKG